MEKMEFEGKMVFKMVLAISICINLSLEKKRNGE